jgi:hypothetical protein
MRVNARRPLYARILLTALMAILLLGAAVAPAFAADEPAPAEWTFAIYVAADNNLESAWDDINVPALLGVPASDDVHVVALVDRLSTDTTELVEFEGDEVTVVATYGEMNFGDGDTFKWFIEEVARLYPAKHLALDMWDHGGAWRGICWDDSSGHDAIRMAELHTALVSAAVPVDILAFDACNMADLAVAYELACTGLVDVMVASEEMIPFAGFPYDLMLAPLAGDPTRSAEEFAADMVDGWGQLYGSLKGWTGVCLSAVDVRAVREAIPALQEWTACLAAGMPVFERDYRAALYASWRAQSSWQFDLIGFCDNLANDKDLKKGDGMKLRSATIAVSDAMKGAVIANHTTHITAEASGIAVWWANASAWHDFEALFGDGVAYAQPAPVGVGWLDLLRAYWN